MRRSLALSSAVVAMTVLISCGLVSSSGGFSGPEPLPRPEERISTYRQPRIIDMTGQPSLARFYDEYDAERGINVTQWVFDSKRDGAIQHATFKKRLDRRVPDKNFNGVIALDWEHPVFEWLDQQPDSPRFQLAIERFIELLKVTRRHRPFAQIGYFGVPRSPYWKRDEAWHARQVAMAEIFKHCDWIGPRAYISYKYGQLKAATPEKQKSHAIDSARIGLEVSELVGGKPVYAWVMHRYTPSNKKYPLEPLDDEQWVQVLEWLMEAEYGGRHLDGIIWWGGDNYYIKERRLPPGTDRAELIRLHEHYFKLMTGVLRPGQR